jgi:linoleoyl-CoA desaturase
MVFAMKSESERVSPAPSIDDRPSSQSLGADKPARGPEEGDSARESRFAEVLRWRIDDFFTEHNLSPKADRAMALKVALGLAVWMAGFLCLYSPSPLLWRLQAAYVLLAIAQIFLLLNVAHDSIHGAVSHRPLVNRLLAYIYDGCGVSSHLVRILHNQGHHSCINLHGEDDPLEGRRVFRFTRSVARKPFHRFQHLYAPLFYALFSIDYVFMRDFEDFFFPAQGCLKRLKHPVREYAVLFAGKSLYLAFMILLPILYLGYSAASVIAGFFVMHLLVGFTVAIVFAPTHILACNDFPGSRSEYEDYVHHIFATTADFATESPVVTWLTGGLNHHIVHHICPQVCHTHYARLTRIAKQTAAEFQIPYREHRTMFDALSAHMSFLKQLGSVT